jgi:hypothetical protein
MDGVNPYYAHPIQDRMAVALAKYNGTSPTGAGTGGGASP